MPVYGFRCPECGTEFDTYAKIADYDPYSAQPCIDCGTPAKRRYDTPPPFKMPMPDHYNMSAGQYVSGEKHLRDVFKRKSDEATERTGIPHNFVPVDLRDTERVGITDATGLGATQDQRHNEGKPPIDLRGIDS